MVRDNKLRTNKFEKVIDIGIRKIDHLIGKMKHDYISGGVKLKNIDKKVSYILDKHGIVGNFRIGYINFARNIAQASFNYTSEALISFAKAEFEKAKLLGLKENILSEIIELFGVKAIPEAPPSEWKFEHTFNTMGTWDYIDIRPPNTEYSFKNGWLYMTARLGSRIIGLFKNISFNELNAKIYIYPLNETNGAGAVWIYLLENPFPNIRNYIISIYMYQYIENYRDYGAIGLYALTLGKQVYQFIEREEFKPTVELNLKLENNTLIKTCNGIELQLDNINFSFNGFGVALYTALDYPPRVEKIENMVGINYIRVR